jgi:hypothetical protein
MVVHQCNPCSLVCLFVCLRYRLQKLLDRAAAAAPSAGDEVYVQRAQQQRSVLAALRVTADAYLREHLRRIAAASRVNERCKREWEETPVVCVLLAEPGCWCFQCLTDVGPVWMPH